MMDLDDYIQDPMDLDLDPQEKEQKKIKFP
jgi:hypothetical protein